MMKSLLVLFTIFCGLTAFSQNYSYSFEGVLSSDQLHSLQTKCQALPFVSTCKIQYKIERGGGEVKFRVMSAKERPEASEQFSPIDMKRELIEAGVSPKEFVQLYD